MPELTPWSKSSAITVSLNAKASLSWTSSTCMLKSTNIKFLCVVGKIGVRWSVMSSINMELVMLSFGGGQYSCSLGHSMLSVQIFCFGLQQGFFL